MYLHKIAIRNFRLLQDVELCLEQGTTVIVGRNNSGKTSLTELFRRLYSSQIPSFCLEDFSLGVHDSFWNAYTLFLQKREELEVRNALPFIEIKLVINYQENNSDLAALGEFIIDLDEDCDNAVILIRYQLKEGTARLLFEGMAPTEAKLSNEVTNVLLDGTALKVPSEPLPTDEVYPKASNTESEAEQKLAFFKLIRPRVHKLFQVTLKAVHPNDPDSSIVVDWAKLRPLIQSSFINAQRGLDDVTHTDSNTLGRILEALFTSALAESAGPDDQSVAKQIEKAIQSIQLSIDANFSAQLMGLLPSMALLGYPGMKDPRFHTETILDASRLLKDHTKIRYSGLNGVNLPESYNGLGARNLIFILLNLLEFFKDYRSAECAPGVHLVFIEEPEAHLHPQMQTVFIRQLSEIAKVFSSNYRLDPPWPVQFVVTTHSSHLANEAPFDATRYFLTLREESASGVFKAEVKDFRDGFGDALDSDREFLHQYMTLTRCDLLFADKAILIEGISERLLLPAMIKKVDQILDEGSEKLASQYISVVEVGGAYAHIFFKLLDFLELPTLIITDIDSIIAPTGKSCRVSEGTGTSNACIKSWFSDDVTPLCLINKCDADKTKGTRRIAYQVPERGRDSCARSLEDAFMLANLNLFGLDGCEVSELEREAWEKASTVKKSDFALKYAIVEPDWQVPRYIAEGLCWLASAGMASLPSDNSAIFAGEVLLDG